MGRRNRRGSPVRLFAIATLGIAALALVIAGASFYRTMRESIEDDCALKVRIAGQEEKSLFVLLTAYYADGKQMRKGVDGHSKGFIVQLPRSTWGKPRCLYCGRNPDFSKLLLQISIWELPYLQSGWEDVAIVTAREPDFAAAVRRPDFNYEVTEDYRYLSFAKIERKKDGHFELQYPTP
ncbi:hypothetical protein AMJ85_08055 [candidate division BRC1 bacterium SM23_51]|nr:MAG: hypothetical protein AMJ85_08055 [candidate division BRC1 bacterium SM23_51]